SAREVSDRLALFRAAGDVRGTQSARAHGSAPRGTTSSRTPDVRVSAPPPTPRMAGAPDRPSGASEAQGDGASDAANAGGPKAGVPKNERPRTDTIALVEANASKAREVPTWLAIVAIVALSLVAGMTTYLVRLKTAGDTPQTPTASADSRAT